jgi:L-aspartate oxidase
MEDYDPKKELAPRDVVSRSILMELRKTGMAKVYLDATHLGASFLRERFPKIYRTCMGYNIDITKDLIPVHPSAHYFMGGVRSDVWGRSSIKALYGAGEVACSGVHGANRLASNSLLEGLVYGARAGKAMFEDLKDRNVPEKADSLPESMAFPEKQSENIARLVKDIAWNHIGIIREGRELISIMERLSSFDKQLSSSELTRKGLQARNIFLISRLIAEAAIKREESRGAHYRSDYPEKLDFVWKVHSILKREKPHYSIVRS